MRNKCLENRGITLVALIITIIVLLILAGVSISFVFNGGILDKSQQAVDEYKNAANKESELLSDIENYFNNVDSNGLATKNIVITTDIENLQIVIPKGMAPVNLKGSGTTTSNPGEDGSVKEIIPVENWKNITADQINKGIVLVDHAITYDGGNETGINPDFNEYVWIPISDISKFKRISWNCKNGYNANGDGIWNGSYLNHPLTDMENKRGYWEDTTTQEYINMINSVEKYKGFYVGRYESSNMQESGQAQIKRNQTVWTNISPIDAIDVSKKVNTSLNSHLLYGIEWDSILNWFIGNAIIGSTISGETKTMDLDDIQTDSTTWGCYIDSQGGAANNAGTRQNTGASEYWKANNIYDMAGNAYEWTQETYMDRSVKVRRGGVSNGDGSGQHTSAQRFIDTNTWTNPGYGFRVGFYI